MRASEEEDGALLGGRGSLAARRAAQLPKLKDLAKAESDHATDVFLEWFVTEQVEEEAAAQAVIDQLRLVEGSPNGLFMIDRELAARTPEAA